MSIVFGPVPSRRLGKSLGINNIPYKVCTYACVYCQIGKTLKMQIKRQEFYEPRRIFEDVDKRVKDIEDENVQLDYITFVPDGEPTLDINLDKEARMLKDIDYPLAIITNSSLIWDENVKNALFNFDYISFKLDAVSQYIWKRVNRPHKSLELNKILEGMLDFRKDYRGKIVTETMLVREINYDGEIEKIAEFLKELKPDIAYIAVPTRPPTESWAGQPDEALIAMAYEEFKKNVENVEYLIGYEGNEFVTLENAREDILSITAVHPMREEAILKLLQNSGKSRDLLDELIKDGKLKKVDYGGHTYYIRKFKEIGIESKNT